MPDSYTATSGYCEHDYDYVRSEGTSFLYRCVKCGMDYWQERKASG